MLPLLAAGAAVAVGMACVLALLEEDFYYFFITPLIVSLPVLVAIAMVVNLGHCRTRRRGPWWEWACRCCTTSATGRSARRNVVARGPGMGRFVEFIGGVPGLPGYVAFRCKMAVLEAHPGPNPQRREPNLGDMLFSAFFYALELLALSAFGAAIGRGLSSAFTTSTWAGGPRLRVPPAAGDAGGRRAGRRGSRLVRAGGAAPIPAGSNPNTQSILFRVEYLPDAADEPFYVSLKGGPSKWNTFAGTLLTQQAIPPESAHALVEQFPDLKAKLKPPASSARLRRAGGVPDLDDRAAAHDRR